MEFDPNSAKAGIYDEIMQFAQGKMAKGLKDKYAPAKSPSAGPAIEEIPGAEGAEGEAEGAGPIDPGADVPGAATDGPDLSALLGAEGELDPELLEKLREALGE